MRAPVGKGIAVQKAKELYAEHGRRWGVPVQVRKIAEVLGITVLDHAMEDDDSGILLVKGTKAIIVINERHHKNRQRFSLAHEVAHYLLHKQDVVDVFHRDQKSSMGKSRIEIEANAFCSRAPNA